MDESIASRSAAMPPAVTGRAALDVDRVRATLMVLGVALHTADVFVSSGDWLVADSHRSQFFDFLVALIHCFRVPGFFLLSGLLFAGSLGRHAAPDLLARQLLRLGLPLLTCALVINGAQQLLLSAYRGTDPWTDFFSASAPMFHLWFLRDLLVLNLIVIGGILLAGRQAPRLGRGSGRLAAWLDRLEGRGPSHWLSVALAGAAASMVLLLLVRLTGIAYLPGFTGLTLFDLAFNAPIFLAGLAMWHRPGWLDAWLRTPLWLLPIAAFAANWGDAASDALRQPLAREAALLVQLLGIWLATGAAVGALGRVRRVSAGAFERLLVDASYTIFLLHHLVVVALALLLLPLDWPAGVKFTLIASATLAICLAAHRWLIRPVPLLRLFFNGRPPAPRPAASAAPA